MNISIQVIPDSQMRPEVSGADWYFEYEFHCDKCGLAFMEKTSHPQKCSKCNEWLKIREWLQVRVSPMSDWRREMLLAIHETVEALMCCHNSVTVAQVDKFDQEYDKTHTFDLDAGDERDAPYRHEHCLATAIERILCAEFGVVWSEYDKELAESYPGPSKKPK